MPKGCETRTYLVTGGAGFIGSNFIHHILDSRENVTVVNIDTLTYAGNLDNLRDIETDERYFFRRIDIRDRQAVEGVFREFNPDYVVNFAAESHVDRSINDPFVFASTNIGGTVNVLTCALMAWGANAIQSGKRFLQISTDEVYGSLELNSNNLFNEETPISPRSPYSASKASADVMVKAFYETYKLPVLITRCSNNYGSFQFPEKLIPLCIARAVAHEEIPVYGTGENIRDWLHVSDHCRAIDLVLENGTISQIYNIGGNNEVCNLSLVKKIIALCEEITGDSSINERLITFVEDRKGHDLRYGICADKIRSELGWCPQVSFDHGLANTVSWYINNQEWVQRIRTGEYQHSIKSSTDQMNRV